MEPIKVSNPNQLPSLALLLPDPWEETLEKLRRLAKFDLGDVYIFETSMGKYTYKIICVEVLNEVDR